MSESYFFAIIPRFLKTEHSFAKTIKPNTKYRLAVFKGIQKCDEMVDGVKSKIVNGKIQLESKELLFNLPYFSPTKNIIFSVKLYEQKPNEQYTQIASYNIGSTQYIRQYKADKQNNFNITGQLKADLTLQFDLFVQKSKQLLEQLIKGSPTLNLKSPREAQEDNASQNSRQLIRSGEGFISPKRKIQRKRGHEGKLRSRSRSRSQDKSQTLITSPKSIPKSTTVIGKNVNTSTNAKSPVKDQKKYKYQPGVNLKYTDTKQIFDIKIQKPSEAVQSPRYPQNSAKSPQTRASFTSPPQNIKQPANTFTRANVASPTQSKSSALTTAPKSQVTLTQGLEIKHNSKVFDIVPKYNVTSPKSEQRKSPGKYEPKRQPKVIQTKDQAPFVKINQVEFKNLQNIKKQNGMFLGNSLQAPGFETLTESTITITVQGVVNEPKAIIIGEDDQIEVKAKPVTKREEVNKDSPVRLDHGLQSTENIEYAHTKSKSGQERRNQVLYVVFLVISIFLIYWAMCPTNRA